LGANRIDHLERQAAPVFKTPAVGIGALVGQGRQKLMEQVAVSGVDFNQVEARDSSTACGLPERFHNGVDAGLVERRRDGVCGGKGDGGWGDGLPSALSGRDQMLAGERCRHAGLAAGVGKLDARTSALGVDKVDDAGKSRYVLVFPNAQIGGRDAALGLDCGGFKHNQTGATLRPGTQMNKVPIGGEAIFRRVLAHGRDTDAVSEHDRAELKRGKKRNTHDLVDVQGWQGDAVALMNDKDERTDTAALIPGFTIPGFTFTG